MNAAAAARFARRRAGRPLLWMAVAVVAVWLVVQVHGLGGDYGLRLLTSAGIWSIAALGYRLAFGEAGLLSLAQAALMGLGGYGAALLAIHFGWPVPLTLGFAMVLPGVVALSLGWLARRLAAHYFALASLAVAELLRLAAVHGGGLTGGANGLFGIPRLPRLLASAPLNDTLLVWLAVAAAAAVSWLMTRGRRGQSFRLLAADETAAASIGINGGRLRHEALVVAGALAGLAGGLQAHVLSVISAGALAFEGMVLILAMTVIGGRGHLAGPIAGALLLVVMPEVARPLQQYYLLAVGGVMLAVLIAAPDGLVRRPRPGTRPVGQTSSVVDRPMRPLANDGPVLRLDDVHKRFGGVRALSGVGLTITAGECVGLVGANGSGKSTIANIVSGLVQPDSGRIMIGGAVIGPGLAPWRRARLGISRVFQSRRLAGHMTVLDNVAVALAGQPTGDAAIQQAAALLEEMGIADQAHALAHTLAHGMARRVEIARALAGRPGLLILDEPAAGLTAQGRDHLAMALRRRQALGMAVLVIEHDLTFLGRIAGRVLCLADGVIVAEARGGTAMSDPTIAAALLGRTASVAGGAS
ncbi:MAG: ATP-binding cassette domain-containing protein [Alphaproteobacteria bacterium]